MKELEAFNMLDTVIVHSVKQSQHKTANRQRGSKYLGVSFNQHGQFQISFKHKTSFMYFGSYYDMYRAAFLYDAIIVQLSGLKAKTNFDYNKAQVLSLLSLPDMVQLCRSTNSEI